MPQEAPDKYQLAGLDDRERGFSRPIDFEIEGEAYRAVLRYESRRLSGAATPTQDAALLDLIQMLHHAGYRQLKTQRSFHNGVYLGSQELWVEHPDPPQPEQELPGFLTKLLQRFRALAATK